MISVSNLTVQFGGKDLFKDVSFLVNPRDRIGLVGKNGAGKTTLLKVFMKQVSQASGSISVPGDIKLGYLPQQLIVSDVRTVFEEVLTTFEEQNDIEQQLEKLNESLTVRTDIVAAPVCTSSYWSMPSTLAIAASTSRWVTSRPASESVAFATLPSIASSVSPARRPHGHGSAASRTRSPMSKRMSARHGFLNVLTKIRPTLVP